MTDSNCVRPKRKVKIGTVVSAKMDKTVVVRTERTFRHPRYEKIVKTAKKYYAHTDDASLKEGDVVEIMGNSSYFKTRPLESSGKGRT